MDTINPIVGNLVKALVYTENGGHPSVGGEKAGGSGEMKSLWQYMPDTWKVYSRQVTGKDDIPLTPENEAAVTYGKVNGWYNQLVKDGVPEDEIPLKIGSMWNAGEHRPVGGDLLLVNDDVLLPRPGERFPDARPPSDHRVQGVGQRVGCFRNGRGRDRQLSRWRLASERVLQARQAHRAQSCARSSRRR